uniref:Uncharacterized protein n=1 Tax=Timema cristinae TaxID=61476 RepID=A0A7R9CLF6_TIMCR|nr:unnamed protein product [Timema cristinae]
MAGLRTTILGAHLVVLMAGLVFGQQSLFRSVPTTVKTSENDTVLLPCYVDNLGGHKVRWWWGSKLLVDSSDPDVTLNSRVKIFPNNTLQVSDLRAEDTGEYNVTSMVLYLDNWEEEGRGYPPSVVPHPGTGLLEVQLGGDVDMGCEAKGVPKPIITWTNRHGDEMQLLDHRPRLRFRADDRQLSGTYTCVAINGVGEPANATIQLRILYIPTAVVFIVSRGLTYLVGMGVEVERVESQSLEFGRVEMVGDVRFCRYLGEFMSGNQDGWSEVVPLEGPAAWRRECRWRRRFMAVEVSLEGEIKGGGETDEGEGSGEVGYVNPRERGGIWNEEPSWERVGPPVEYPGLVVLGVGPWIPLLGYSLSFPLAGVGEPANATIQLRILYIPTAVVFIVSRGLTYLVGMGVEVERVESQSLEFGRVEMVGDVRFCRYLGEFMSGNQDGWSEVVPLEGPAAWRRECRWRRRFMAVEVSLEGEIKGGGETDEGEGSGEVGYVNPRERGGIWNEEPSWERVGPPVEYPGLVVLGVGPWIPLLGYSLSFPLAGAGCWSLDSATWLFAFISSRRVVSSSELESGQMGFGRGGIHPYGQITFSQPQADRSIYPPEVTVDKTWIHAAPGLRSELVCRVMADPQARVEWVFQDRPVVTSSRVIALSINEKNTLLIRSVRASELGHYTCKASNMMGHSQQVVELSGVANSAVFKSEYHRVPSNSNYTLVWEVDSYSAIIEYNLMFRRYNPTVNTPWTKLVIPADVYAAGPLHTRSYTLTGLSPATVYEGMVLSRNRFGWSRPSAILRFGTDGSGSEDNELVQHMDTRDENLLPVQVAAMVHQYNSVAICRPILEATILLAAVATWYETTRKFLTVPRPSRFVVPGSSDTPKMITSPSLKLTRKIDACCCPFTLICRGGDYTSEKVHIDPQPRPPTPPSTTTTTIPPSTTTTIPPTNTTTIPSTTTTIPPTNTTTPPATTIIPPTNTTTPPSTTTSIPPANITTPPATTTIPPTNTTTPPPTTTTAPVTTPKPSPKPEPGTWVVQNHTTNITCIIVEMAMQMNVSYTISANETKHLLIDVPKTAGNVTGNCGAEIQTLSLSWATKTNQTNKFALEFLKNDTTKQFWLAQIDVIHYLTELHLVSYSPEFNTPVSMSYRCMKKQLLNLSLVQGNTTIATLEISNTHFEAFHDKTDTVFGVDHDCLLPRGPNVALVPIAVSCVVVIFLLAILLVTIFRRRQSQAQGYLGISRADSVGGSIEDMIPLQDIPGWKRCWRS